MTITSSEIINKEFSSRLKGYDQSEVNSFLDQVGKDVEKLTDENQQLNEKVERLSEKLDEYVEKHDSLNRSILVAQDAADRLKEDAHAEANHLVTEAQSEADRIRKASRQESHEILEHVINKVYFVQKELEVLRQQSVQFKKELHDMLKSYHSTIMDNRWDKVLNIETINKIDINKTKEAIELAATLSDKPKEEPSQEDLEESHDSNESNEGHTTAIELPEIE